MSNLIDGKFVASQIRNKIKSKVDGLVASNKRPPCLVVVLVGNNGGSLSYVSHKIKACEEVGFESRLIHYNEDISEAEVLNTIEALNSDPSVDGFIVQLPLPKHISVDKVTAAISPEKDVDGFSPANVGRMVKGWSCHLPATPYGIIKLLEHYNIETSGKHCVVVGRSQIVGTPMAFLMVQAANPGNATVTICHSRTTNLKQHTLNADILIAAIGQPKFITADMVKPGAFVIDVGTTRVPDASKKSGFVLTGDVDFEGVAPLASMITPVPGGVGPMTIAGLLLNTLRAANGELKF